MGSFNFFFMVPFFLLFFYPFLSPVWKKKSFPQLKACCIVFYTVFVAKYLLTCEDSVRPILKEYASLWGLTDTYGASLVVGGKFRTNVWIKSR